eukprot:6212313-Pleurochrysis_carterae.AAC.19
MATVSTALGGPRPAYAEHTNRGMARCCDMILPNEIGATDRALMLFGMLASRRHCWCARTGARSCWCARESERVGGCAMA